MNPFRKDWLSFNADRWSRTRAKGFLHFILSRGLLGIGLPIAAVMTVVYYRQLRKLVSLGVFSEGDVAGLLRVTALSAAVTYFCGGLVIAVAVWCAAEWQYRRSNRTARPPVLTFGKLRVRFPLVLFAGLAAAVGLITALLPWIERARDASFARLGKIPTAESEQFYERTRALRAAARTTDLSSLDRAQATAQSVLDDLPRWKNSWDYGNGLHYAHLVLGRLALRENNLDEAKRRLLAAGRTPGSPQLDDYGPDMTLAEEILRTGESASVIEYFDLCSKFWLNKEKNKLGEWSAIAREGRIPDFGCLSGLSCQTSVSGSKS